VNIELTKKLKFLRQYNEPVTSGIFLRLGILFLLYPVGHYIPFWFEKLPLLASLMQQLYTLISLFIVKVSVLFLKIIYPSISVTTGYMIVINGYKVIFLSPPCTGLDPMLRMSFIFLFYPLAIKTKLWVYPLSMFFILLAATLHFMILIPIAYEANDWFAFSHDWLTKVIFYGFYFMVWVMWEKILAWKHKSKELKNGNYKSS